MACPSENVLSAFVEGHLSPAKESPPCTCTWTSARIAVSSSRAPRAGTFGGSAATILPEHARTVAAGSGPSASKSAGSAAEAGPQGAPRVDGYRIRERIGRGAMGEVFLAHDEQLDRPVAIKFLWRPPSRRRASAS